MQKVILNQQLTDLGTLQIPDLWHLAQWLKSGARTKNRRPTEQEFKQQSDMVLNVWHTLHHLLDAVRALPEPDVTGAVPLVDGPGADPFAQQIMGYPLINPVIKLVHPLATMDKSDPEGRYWESEIVDVHVAVLFAWIGEFMRQNKAAWHPFLLEKLTHEMGIEVEEQLTVTVSPAPARPAGSVNGQARLQQADIDPSLTALSHPRR